MLRGQSDALTYNVTVGFELSIAFDENRRKIGANDVAPSSLGGVPRRAISNKQRTYQIQV